MNEVALFYVFKRLEHTVKAEIKYVVVIKGHHVEAKALHIDKRFGICAYIRTSAKPVTRALALIVESSFEIKESRVTLVYKRSQFGKTDITLLYSALNNGIPAAVNFIIIFYSSIKERITLIKISSPSTTQFFSSHSSRV